MDIIALVAFFALLLAWMALPIGDREPATESISELIPNRITA
jgi:hypothetical protein